MHNPCSAGNSRRRMPCDVDSSSCPESCRPSKFGKGCVLLSAILHCLCTLNSVYGPKTRQLRWDRDQVTFSRDLVCFRHHSSWSVTDILLCYISWPLHCGGLVMTPLYKREASERCHCRWQKQTLYHRSVTLNLCTVLWHGRWAVYKLFRSLVYTYIYV